MTTTEIIREIYAMLSASRRRQLAWLALFMLVVGIAEIGLAGAISLMGVAMASPSSLEKIAPIRFLYQLLPDVGLGAPEAVRMLFMVMVLVCVASLLKNALSALLTYRQNEMAQALSWDVGGRLFHSYLYAPYIWHTRKNTADLNTYIGWQIYVAIYGLAGLDIVAQSGIMILLMCGALLASPQVTAVMFAVLLLVSLIIYKSTQQKAKQLGTDIANLELDCNKLALSALQGMREVQIYNQQEAFYKKYQEYAAPTILYSARRSLYPNTPNWITESVTLLLMAGAVLFMAAHSNSVGVITGTLTLMFGVAWRLLPAMNKIVGSVLALKSAHETVQEILVECRNTPPGSSGDGQRSFEHKIELTDITFTYPDTDKPILNKIHFEISKGEMVGLVGLSGSGKSTLVGLLTGLMTPTGGNFSIDGRAAVPAPGFLKIGYVPQSPYLMDAPLAENVAFSSWGEKVDEERVRACCRMAAMEFMDKLPLGLNTVLGERGVRLSGGQAQRVAIARALYGNPDILIFDEATSALDSAAEAAIQKTILSLQKNMTIILVAHRLSTVEACDALYWLKDGLVHAHGPAREVLPEYEEFLRRHAPEHAGKRR